MKIVGTTNSHELFDGYADKLLALQDADNKKGDGMPFDDLLELTNADGSKTHAAFDMWIPGMGSASQYITRDMKPDGEVTGVSFGVGYLYRFSDVCEVTAGTISLGDDGKYHGQVAISIPGIHQHNGMKLLEIGSAMPLIPPAIRQQFGSVAETLAPKFQPHAADPKAADTVVVDLEPHEALAALKAIDQRLTEVWHICEAAAQKANTPAPAAPAATPAA